MRRNDLKVMNRMLEKTIEHEGRLANNREEIDHILAQLEENKTFKDNLMDGIKDLETQMTKDVKDLNGKVAATDERFRAFRHDYFPKYMAEFQDMVIAEVTAQVNKTTSQVVTEEMLAEALVTERTTNIQSNIDKMGASLQSLMEQTQETMTASFSEQVSKQARDLTNTNEYIRQVNTMVMVHEQSFIDEEKEPDELSPEEMEEQGITVRYGMMFDKDGNMIKMTKK